MSDQFRETTVTSWGTRILDSFAGALIGLVCFLGAFVLLWWGEERSIERIRLLDEGRALVVAVDAEKLDEQNKGRLVHFSGRAVTTQTLKDADFGVQEKALKLSRIVEMYQWKESSTLDTKEQLGGGETTETVYSYTKEWSEQLIDSAHFKYPSTHENPASMPVSPKDFIASGIHVGAFKLSQAFVAQISDFVPYPLTEKHHKAIPKTRQKNWTLKDGKYISIKKNTIPHIGDVRVSYSIIMPTDISVIGRQGEGKLEPFATKNGTIALLETGDVDAASMFTHAKHENVLLTWAIRLGGIVMIGMGIALMLRPIRMVGAVVPFIGSVLGVGIGIVATIVALGLGLLTIALAWLFYRPIIGILVLMIAVGVLVGGWLLTEKRKQPL